MLSDVYSDQRNHEYQGPSRSVRHPRASAVGGGTFATCQDGSRCVVAGKDVLRILRISDPPRSRTPSYHTRGQSVDTNNKICTGPGGATIETGPNMWSASGLKVDSAPTDVIWARGIFDTKIVTSARNGEIIYWDINRTGPKYETRIKEHKRAVTKLAMSPFLPYLFVSGSQDGHLRVWDLRTPPSSSMKVYHPVGIRALALSPVPSNPMTVCTGLEGGNILRWDLRNRALPLERVALAHSSTILSMDWQLPSMKETGLGWLVTSGMDRRVKIWDLCLSPGTSIPTNTADRDAILLYKKMGPRAFRTLHTPFPVRKVCWRPNYDCEVAIVSNNESENETVEIWDIRRGWIGKWALDDAEGGITDIAFVGSHKIWAQHANGTFAQHDLRESFRPLDAIPRVAMSWAASGSLAFVACSQPSVDVPYDDIDPRQSNMPQDLYIRPKATSDPVYTPHHQTLGVQDIPLFDYAGFASLSRSYIFQGDRMRICEVNAERAMEAGQAQAAQTWHLLLSQLTDLEPHMSPVHSIRPPSHIEPQSRLSSAPASIFSRHSTDPSDRHGAVHHSAHIDTRPMETSPSSFYRRQDQSRRGQETPLSLSPSPRPTTIALPTIPSQPAARASWLDAPVSPVSPYAASGSSTKLGTPSRRASTVLPITPRAPRPSLRRASMSTPGNAGGSPTSDSSKTHKRVHVGEGALDDSDSSSESEASASGDSDNDHSTTQTERGTQSTSAPSSVVRVARGTRTQPSPLSKLLGSRDDSPDGHLASDERSLGEYDSDGSDGSHSPRSSSSGSSSNSPPISSARKLSIVSLKDSERQTRTASSSPVSTRDTGSHRALTKQESQSTIRTVTAPSDTASTRSVDRVSFDAEKHPAKDPLTGPPSEGMSTRRPSPQRPRSSMAAGLGLSNMVDSRAGKAGTHTSLPVSRLSEAQVADIKEEEARLREIGWAALRDAVEWFAEKGDVQMCAFLAIVAPKELRISDARAVRFVEAYIELLSRLQLHTVAAHIRKHVTYETIRETTQAQTTVYSSCGSCRSPVKVGIAGGPILCQSCKALPTLCAICHLPVRKLLVHCPSCGHGGHQACFRKFYLSRPLTEIATTAPPQPHGRGDSHSTTDTSSTTYYSLSDGSERETRGDDADEDDCSEKDGSAGRGSDRDVARGREDAHEYESGTKERRPKMMLRVMGHACAAGCGHWCWAANERFAGT